MEQLEIGSSLKDIPIPPKVTYLKEVIAKLTDFTHCLKWKTLFYVKKQQNWNTKITPNASPKESWKLEIHPHLIPSWRHLKMNYGILSKAYVSNDTLRSNAYQRKPLKDLLKKLKSQKGIAVHSGKTKNSYTLGINLYHQLLSKKITNKHKVAPNNTFRTLNYIIHEKWNPSYLSDSE